MDPAPSSPQDRERRFREIYDSAYVELLRFVRRRVHPTHAEDFVGDVMLVAWRRLDDVPAELSAARAWLFGVARKTLQNSRRRDDRYEAVAVRLAEAGDGSVDAGEHPDLVAHRVDIAADWQLLSSEGSVPAQGPWPFARKGWFTLLEGVVGSDVAGVTVRTPIGTDVVASVSDGRFAAWWPSDPPSSKHPEVMGNWSYTVTLSDGSTHQVEGG